MNVYHPTSYKIKKGEKFIFDANVWIKMMPSFQNLTNANHSAEYSKLLQEILDNECKIGILNIEISEIFNVFIREQSKAFLQSKGRWATFKKHYRPSAQFETDKNLILNEIENLIFNIGEKINDCFESIETEKILDTSRSDYDFNDNYMYRYCEKNGYTFVTHDKDYNNFLDLNVNVISVI